MRQVLSYLCCTTMLTLACLETVKAEEKADKSEEKAPLSFDSLPCTKEELMTYFPQPLVKAILIRSHVPHSQADGIAEELAHKGQELEKIVSDKAAKMDPNPFKDLSQRDMAIKIYRETLYEVFAKVLKSHGITNEDQIQIFLDEMQMAKSKLFIECIRKQQASSKEPASPSPFPSS